MTARRVNDEHLAVEVKQHIEDRVERLRHAQWLSDQSNPVQRPLTF